MSQYKYSKTIRVQKDVLIDFFVDDVNKTFGFFFDGAPQFICPFENFAAFSVSNSGNSTSYSRGRMVGVGIGTINSVGIGSYPVANTNLPKRYDCSITYFDKNGLLKTYNISFSCYRSFAFDEGNFRSVDEAVEWENMVSYGTNKNLNDIASYLIGIKESGKLIKEGIISVNPVNYNSVEEDVKSGQNNKEQIKNSMTVAESNLKKQLIKSILIIGIVILTIALMVLIINVISNAVKEDETKKINMERAERVVRMIDELGEISLSSEAKILEVERAYTALPLECRSYVTNSAIMSEARTKYEKLLNEKREEETKDDPTRTITIEDLRGRWQSGNLIWAIENLYGSKSVFYWSSNQLATSIISKDSITGSSYIAGYNNATRRMKVRLLHYTLLGQEYLDVYLTKDKNGVLTMYYGQEVFHKVNQ